MEPFSHSEPFTLPGDPQIESFLRGSVPRRVRYKGGRRAFCIVAGVWTVGAILLFGRGPQPDWAALLIFGGVGSVLFMGAFREIYAHRALVTRGVAARASISAKREHKGSKGGTTYSIAYVFRVEGVEEPLSGEDQVFDAALWHNLREGERITVLYNARNPKQHVALLAAEYQVV